MLVSDLGMFIDGFCSKDQKLRSAMDSKNKDVPKDAEYRNLWGIVSASEDLCVVKILLHS